MKKTKFLISGVGLNLLQDSGEFPCAICRSGVGVNSIECSQCKLWVHKKCSGLTGRLVADPEFVCQRCRGVACPIDGRPVTHVDVDGTHSTWKPPSAIWVTCFRLVVVAIALLLLAVVRPGASSESYCQSSLQSTSLSRHAARYSQLVFGQLYSIAVRPGPQTPPIYNGFAEMTVP